MRLRSNLGSFVGQYERLGRRVKVEAERFAEAKKMNCELKKTLIKKKGDLAKVESG